MNRIGTEEKGAYAAAGVDIAAGEQATSLMKAAVQAMARPVLVAATDGVGTKTMVAAKINRWDSIGQDIVNHCVNDILVQGARTLFFLDYMAAGRLNPQQIATVVQGAAQACRAAGCALLGGETAEMPGVYRPDA